MIHNNLTFYKRQWEEHLEMAISAVQSTKADVSDILQSSHPDLSTIRKYVDKLNKRIDYLIDIQRANVI